MSVLFNHSKRLIRLWACGLAAQLSVLVSTGAERTTDVVLQRKVVMVNACALVALVSCVILPCYYIPRGVWALTVSSLVQLVASVCYVGVWSLNRRGAVLLARLYLFGLTILMVLGSILIGQGSILLSHYLFLLVGILAVTFFKISEWRLSAGLVVLSIVLFLFFEIHGWPTHISVLEMPPAAIKLIRVTKVGTCVVVLMLVMLLTEVMMARYVDQLDMLGRTDVLTGLPNRRWFFSMLTREMTKARHGGPLLAVALVDVDYFKRINDEEGHALGDKALQHVANQLSAHTRSDDFVARMGGEEFILLMQVDNAMDAEIRADRVRAGIAASPFLAPSGPRQITVSIGVALYSPGIIQNRLLRAADLAMYRAKSEGRNLVCVVEAHSLNTVPSALQYA